MLCIHTIIVKVVVHVLLLLLLKNCVSNGLFDLAINASDLIV